MGCLSLLLKYHYITKLKDENRPIPQGKKKKPPEVWEPLLQVSLKLFLSISLKEDGKRAEKPELGNLTTEGGVLKGAAHSTDSRAGPQTHTLRGAVFNTFPKPQPRRPPQHGAEGPRWG